MSEPHTRGRRVSVHQVYEFVEVAGEDPDAVADRFDCDVADLYHALAYSRDRPREMRAVESKRREDVESFQRSVDRPRDVDPDAA